MTRREREEAALDRLAHPPTDETDYTYEKDVRTIREALRLAHAREDATRKIASDLLVNDGALDAIADGSPIPDIFLEEKGLENYLNAVMECKIGKKLIAILDGEKSGKAS